MKAIGLILLALSLVGCASKSKFASDPRAAVVGPAYLDYIAQYPRDRDTEFYYPAFTVHSLEKGLPPSTTLPGSAVAPSISAILISIPEPTQQIKNITGKGYPSLERDGLRLFTPPQ